MQNRPKNFIKISLLFLVTSFIFSFMFIYPQLTIAEDVDAQTAEVSTTTELQKVFPYAAPTPAKNEQTRNLEDVKIIPGGQSIGVQLQTKGVLVVGHHLVNGDTGVISPGEDAKINVGDVIVKINGEPIEEMHDIKSYVEEAGEEREKMDITIKRGNDTIDTELEPAFDQKERKYKIGLYIRDSAAGIGTMTFYDPVSGKYGALGHVISDMDTKKPIEIENGSIVNSSVTSIEKGDHGVPGEKQAKFEDSSNRIGTINRNTDYGIFGVLEKDLDHQKYNKPYPVALSHEVEEGPAKILTVIDGEDIEEFDIEVVSSVPQNNPSTKGMVIQITDSRLLKETGGIVQGMSGSPIIQNDKVIGAVTHVFVNDPTSGYGVHIEWMLQDAEIIPHKEEQTAA